uniref:Uncharacterized protein LOC111113644 n=1 Tax=Crassostrea virginica TaxID=6565 RepID=A0A8B8BWH8_CRAVI|nr:uncharacterized protein LOC111113644 [Crassostrea virginica]
MSCCPRSGYYGNNCSVPCPDPQCNYCDLDTGTCRGGCNPGYKGHRLRKSRNKPAKKYKPESPTREMDVGQDGKSEFDSVNEGYQELGELGRSNTTYDTLQ